MNKDKDKKVETIKLLYFFVISTVIFFIVIVIGYKFNLLSQTYNNIRPIFLEDGGDRCLQDLDRINIEYKRLGDIREGNCLVKNEFFPGHSYGLHNGSSKFSGSE